MVMDGFSLVGGVGGVRSGGPLFTHHSQSKLTCMGLGAGHIFHYPSGDLHKEVLPAVHP